MKDISVKIDWKFALACGASTGIVIFAVKMSDAAVDRLSNYLAELCREQIAQRLSKRD